MKTSLFQPSHHFKIVNSQKQYEEIFHQKNKGDNSTDLQSKITIPCWSKIQKSICNIKRQQLVGYCKYQVQQDQIKERKIELVNEDLRFLETYSQVFMYEGMYLLNKYILLQSLNFLQSQSSKRGYSPNKSLWMNKFISKLKPISYSIYQSFQIQRQQDFNKLFSLLYEHWQLRVGLGLQTNLLRKSLFKTRVQTKQKDVKAEQKNVVDQLRKLKKENESYFLNFNLYESLKVQNQKKKKQFIMGIKEFYLEINKSIPYLKTIDFVENKTIDFSKINEQFKWLMENMLTQKRQKAKGKRKNQFDLILQMSKPIEQQTITEYEFNFNPLMLTDVSTNNSWRMQSQK